MKKHILSLLLLLVLSYGTVRPLLVEGFFSMHDDTQVGRVIAMGKALRNGQFPVRWVSDLGYGYGYPLFNFYGPLPYYAGGFLYALGLPALDAAKLMFLMGFILSAVTMYVLSSYWFGISGGILSAVFYLYAPYHAVQTYVRGAVGELWAYAFLPLVVWGALQIREDRSQKKSGVIAGIGLAGIILSHTIMGYVAVMTLFMIGLIWWVKLVLQTHDQWRFAVNFSRVFVIGLGISAFFWLPAVVEMHLTTVSGQIGPTANYRDHFVCISQLWDSPWGFGGSAKGCIDGMSYKLGKLSIVLTVVSLLIWIMKRRNDAPRSRYVMFGIGLTVVSVFFMLQASQFFWDFIPNVAYIQYPWRLLIYAALGVSMAAGASVWIANNRLVRWIFVGLACAAVVSMNAKLFREQLRINAPSLSYETPEELRYRVSKISDEYLPPDFMRPQKPSESSYKVLAESSVYTAEVEVDTETYTKIALQSNADTVVTFQRTFFPGWEYQVNGKRVLPSVQNSLPSVPVSSGESVLEMHFYNTLVRSIGNLLSVITLSVLCILYGTKKIFKTIA